MTLADVGFMLLGALLLAGGVLVASLADRIRGLRALRREQRQTPREYRQAATPKMTTIDPSDTIFVPDEDPAATRRGDRPLPNNKPAPINTGMAGDVVNALVAAGYHKRTATSAVQACDMSERGSLADWTRAALRRSHEAVAS